MGSSSPKKITEIPVHRFAHLLDDADDNTETPTSTADRQPAECLTVTAGELSQYLGISPRQVRDWASRGVLTRDDSVNYKLKESIRGYCEALRLSSSARGTSTTLTAERIRLAGEQADKIALANAASRSELVSAYDVESTWSGILRDIRATMLAIPSRVQQRHGHLSAADIAAIDREIRDALTEAGNAG